MKKKTKTKPIATIDVDNAYNVSTGTETVYFDVAKNSKGWWMSAIWEDEHQQDNLTQDAGPFKTEKQAQMAGLNAATEWMCDNDCGAFEIDSRLMHLANF